MELPPYLAPGLLGRNKNPTPHPALPSISTGDGGEKKAHRVSKERSFKTILLPLTGGCPPSGLGMLRSNALGREVLRPVKVPP
jgi:hypothetical protein